MTPRQQVSFHRLWLDYFLNTAPDEILRFSGERTVGFVLDAGLKVLLGPWALLIPTNAIAGLAGRLLTDTTVETAQRWRQTRVMVDPTRAGVIYTLQLDRQNQLLIARTPRSIVLRDFEAQLSDMVGAPIALLDQEAIYLNLEPELAPLPPSAYTPVLDQRDDAIAYLSQIYRTVGISPDRFTHLFDAPVFDPEPPAPQEVAAPPHRPQLLDIQWPEPEPELPPITPPVQTPPPAPPVAQTTEPSRSETGSRESESSQPVFGDGLTTTNLLDWPTTRMIKWLLVVALGTTVIAIQAWNLHAIVILAAVMSILGLILFHRILITLRHF